MNNDATEAALGLLGLSPLNATPSHPHPQPHPHHVAQTHGPSLTSTSVGVAIDRTSTPHIISSPLPPSLVPLKRKQPSPALSTTASPLSSGIPRDSSSSKSRQPSHPPAPPLSTKSSTVPIQRYSQQHTFSPIISTSVPPQTLPTSQLPLASPSISQYPLALSDVPPPPDSDAISCICGFTYDDGFSIACDDCSRWCHAACFGIVQGGVVPEFWKCWVCDPTVEVDKERAVKIQKGRLKAMRSKASHATNGSLPGPATINGVGGNTVVDEGCGGMTKPASRRKTSPGAERKSRRGSAVAAAIEGSGSSRKKRRASMLSPVDPSSPSIPPPNHSSMQSHTSSPCVSHSNGNGPATSSTLPPTPISFPPDVYPNPSVYAQLLRVAKAWRGVTALNPSPLVHPPPRTYSDGGYARVDSQGYRDRYGYSMSPLDSTTPVILDENAADVYVPRTVLQTDSPMSCSTLHSALHSQCTPPATCTPAHLRPPSPRLHVASDPSPFSHASIYPSPPISSFMSPSVPSSSHPRPCPKFPLTPSTNIVSSSANDTIPAATLLAPYTAAIVPSATYLADPLNGYAHLGMGKPQVRLVGGGWGVGLDARGIGGVHGPSDSNEKENGNDAGKEDVEDGKARWARCGCWPNAVVRPVICNGRKRGEGKRVGRRHKPECVNATSDGNTTSTDDDLSQMVNGRSVPPLMSRLQGQQTDESSDQDDTPLAPESDVDPATLSFALFALRDLRADEEIVLGWEWDDGHAVHMLPALMESPGLFAPAHLHHLRAQFTSILHALSSTFTTCACGSSTRDCAVRVMESVVEGRWPWPGGKMTPAESEEDSSDVDCIGGEWEDSAGDVDVEGDDHLDLSSSRNRGLGMNVEVDIEMDTSIEVDRQVRRVKKRKVRKKGKMEDGTPKDGGARMNAAVSGLTLKPMAKKAMDLGPLVGVKRGFRTREREPMNGGWGGVEIVPSSLRPSPELGVEDHQLDNNGEKKARVADDGDDKDINLPLSALPPRMRKAWAQFPSTQPESKEERPRDHSKRAESWRSHERWRSPFEMNAESPIFASDAVGGSGKGDVTKPGSSSGDGEDGADGQETEFDTETEADGLDDTRQMPPPPMPASLDPTTVSSLAHAHTVRSLSPRGSIQRDKNGVAVAWVPPVAPTPTSASSGRSSEPLSQSAVTSVPPNSNSARSPVSSQINLSSPSAPFPPAVQAQVQSDLPASVQSQTLPLVSSVSPSATFSKLSLHSPDTSSSPHLSVLFNLGESASSSSASGTIHRISDLRVPSPPLYRPSKPLHVHPQNESPSFSTPLSAPAITLKSPDGVRDTPAEAQYQQPYRSSPESRHEIHPSPDVDKKRPANGEAHRVRFASPEILCGFPRLRGKATSDNLESAGADDEISANPEAPTVVDQKEDLPLANDTMDIDGDVGSNEEEDNKSSHAKVPENRTNCDLDDECSLLQVPGSPHSQSPSESLPHSFSTIMNGEPEKPSSPPGSVDGTQVEPMSVDPEPPQLTREISPPPAPKVKMSLKDFALRKKKQREEEMAARALRSPVTSDKAGMPSSPNLDVQKDLASEHFGVGQAADSGSAVDSHAVRMNGMVKEDTLDSPENILGETDDPGRTEDKTTATAVDNGPLAPAQASCTVAAMKTAEATSSSRLSCPSTTLRHVSGERHVVDSKPPMTLVAKMETMDAPLPNGPASADDCTPDVVSFAPEPPPPPLTIKQTSETTVVDCPTPASSISKLIAPLNPPLTSASASISTSASTSTSNSRSNSVGVPVSTSNANPLPYPHLPTSTHLPPSRRPSHEDGEITSSTPPKTYLPRSHTPPTQPRSFHAIHPPSPSFGPTSSSTIPVPRRPAPLLSRSPLSNSSGPTPTPTSSRPLPSGPRALRGSMTQSTHAPPHPSTRPPYVGSQYIPRGPSADRDRIDWDRGDRQWVAQARSRGRAGSNGWGR